MYSFRVSCARWLAGWALGLMLLPPAWAQTMGALATAHPLATEAGQHILAQGGNAFDAAVAVAAVLAVVEPYSSGLGGGGFFLLHRAQDGRQVFLDARETAPAGASLAHYRDAQGRWLPRATTEGAKAAAIPGLPAALVHLARHYGRLPLTQTLAPAIALAQDGFPVDERYRTMAKVRFACLHGQEEAASQFLDRGAVPAAGARLRQPALARTLARLAKEGRAGFYGGPVAREMVVAVRRAGGFWHVKDLTRYRVRERRPLVVHYRGMRIVAAPPPSAAGVALAQSLTVLSAYDLQDAFLPQRMHWVVEALRRAYHDRRFLGDPDFIAMPLARLLSPAYLAARRASIDDDRATSSTDLDPAPPWGGGHHTTHFSIVDGAGNRVAATLSINLPFGACFVAGRTGVLLNSEMDDFSLGAGRSNAYGLAASAANALAPGRRPLSSMAPTFVEDERGVLILGTPGGSRIISTVLLAILRYAAQPTVDLRELVSAPRYHHQYLPDRIEVEPEGFPQEVLDDLTLRGHVVQVTDRKWGNMQVVWLDRRSGRAFAASDPRGQGSGMAWY
ncbi:gamma-glutamyltransferase [Thiobacter aerophilum]|uniref:Glutathione hydrolase proenzyme n=1 Tax=Thiobacter aerophilum TaxID=3121275 RepID=A0ABV0EFU8_9BURK